MPFFSVIIPLYNKENFIEKTIQSVLQQSFQDFEIIIINDGSTDRSEEKVLEFKDARIQYFKKENAGVAIARNLGIEKATSDYICFLDADDYWYPNFLETYHRYIQKFPTHKVFSSAVELEIKNTLVQAEYSIKKTNDFEIVDFFEASNKECILWTSCVVLHKSVLDAIGTFDTNISKGEDTELWIRIGLNYPIFFIWSIVSRYVFDPKSVSRNYNYYLEPFTFDKYAEAEKNNILLKKYLDFNRYTAVLKCKVQGNRNTSEELLAKIDFNNLSWKKRILIHLPPSILKVLIQIKFLLAKMGLSRNVFR